MKGISRRLFGKIAAGSAAAAASGLSSARLFAKGQAGSAPNPTLCIPEGFLWGCATAAYQVEGGGEGRRPRAVALHVLAHARQDS